MDLNLQTCIKSDYEPKPNKVIVIKLNWMVGKIYCVILLIVIHKSTD